MTLLQRWALLCACATALSLPVPAPARAQEPTPVSPPPHQQVLSANPFGLLFELFNAEYERVVSRSATAGFGGSFFEDDGDDYLNADVFWRFYPNADPLDGWAFGVKAGVTNVPDQGSYFGAGFDVNRSWLLGLEDNFYVGIGFGLKRLIGAKEAEFGLTVIPTLRIVNVGYAF